MVGSAVFLQIPAALLGDGSTSAAADGQQQGSGTAAPTPAATVPGTPVAPTATLLTGAGSADRPRASLQGRAYLRLGLWQWALNDVSA